MQRSTTIVFRGIRGGDALEADIRRRLDRLATYYPSLLSARVLVELAGRHRRHGNYYHVRIELAAPGGEIVVARRADSRASASAAAAAHKHDQPRHDHRDAAIVIRDAFAATRRQLQDFARRQRGAVKARTRQPAGRVRRIFPAQGYGFLEDGDGREIYFQRNSVVGDGFDALDVGSPVRFVERPGVEGPRASTVRLGS